MYTDSTLQSIDDNTPYTDSNGVKYPSNFPKNEIAELYPVTTITAPTDVVIDGYHIELIDVTYTQVWDTSPLPDKTWEDISNLQDELFENKELQWRIIRFQTQTALTAQATTETDIKYQELLQYCQNIRNADETNHATPQEALDALNALTVPAI